MLPPPLYRAAARIPPRGGSARAASRRSAAHWTAGPWDGPSVS